MAPHTCEPWRTLITSKLVREVSTSASKTRSIVEEQLLKSGISGVRTCEARDRDGVWSRAGVPGACGLCRRVCGLYIERLLHA